MTRDHLAKDLRSAVRATIDEWLTERSHTMSLAITQLVEDAVTRLEQAHAARLAEMQAQAEAAASAHEHELAEVVRAGRRRRRASARATELELREKVERLEHSLMAASLEGIDRLREVERREAEKRADLEQALLSRIRDRDEEIERLKKAVSGDQYYDALHDQLLSRRPDRQH